MGMRDRETFRYRDQGRSDQESNWRRSGEGRGSRYGSERGDYDDGGYGDRSRSRGYSGMYPDSSSQSEGYFGGGANGPSFGGGYQGGSYPDLGMRVIYGGSDYDRDRSFGGFGRGP